MNAPTLANVAVNIGLITERVAGPALAKHRQFSQSMARLNLSNHPLLQLRPQTIDVARHIPKHEGFSCRLNMLLQRLP